MSIDDQIRTATQAFGATVRGVRPLDLPAPVEAPREPRRSPASRHWMTWGVPLAAAAAVVAIALSLAAIHHDNTMPGRPPVPVGGSQGIPRYFVAMKTAGTSGSRALIVGDDQTGAVIATVPAPRGVLFGGVNFGSVTGTADDRTFIVSGINGYSPQSKSDPLFTFYLLRIAPGSAHPYRLTRLSIAPMLNRCCGPALSPDGSELAIERAVATDPYDDELTIFSVATGKALRTWGMRTPPDPHLSWLPDGRHVLFEAEGSAGLELRSVDVTARGTDLLAASRLLLTIPLTDDCGSVQATPDGTTAVCVTEWGSNPGAANGATSPPLCSSANATKFVIYSVRTGKPVRVPYRYHVPCKPAGGTVLWMDASASHVIGAVMSGSSAAPDVLTTGSLGVITQAGGFQPIKLPKAITAQDYPYMAF